MIWICINWGYNKISTEYKRTYHQVEEYIFILNFCYYNISIMKLEYDKNINGFQVSLLII